jgi:hypothetical protein
MQGCTAMYIAYYGISKNYMLKAALHALVEHITT